MDSSLKARLLEAVDLACPQPFGQSHPKVPAVSIP
jgi:hypothetical protein